MHITSTAEAHVRTMTKGVGSATWLRAGLSLCVASACMAAATAAQPKNLLLLHDPTASRTQIAFTYAGSIWVANRDGSAPRRLTAGGHEGTPFFSPDGTMIAFTGDRVGSYAATGSGTGAVYVVSAAGGTPRRLTHHPDDIAVVGWTPDGKRILFSSRRSAFDAYHHSVVQLFTVPLEGGFATELPLPRAVQASFAPDASRIAYVPNIQWEPNWKRYRGGQTTPIWIADLGNSAVQASIPRDNSNDFNPMWVGDRIYFLSDRSGPVTLFAYDLNSKQVKQVVNNDGFDLKSASASSDTIINEQFGSLHLIDLKSESDQTLDIKPVADLPDIRPHLQKVEPAQIRSAAISPTGDRAVFGVRGEVLTVSAANDAIRNLTHTTNVVELDPAWSPDGKSVAYLSDESGEYALHIKDQSGHGEVRKIKLGSPNTFYYSPTWSPDSMKIGYTDKRLNYWYIDLRKRIPIRVDTDLYSDFAHTEQLAWSPDSRWIAYIKQLRSHLHAVFLYSLAQAKSYQLTDGMSDAQHVAFDQSGKYLYFSSSIDTALSSSRWDMTQYRRPVTRRIYLTVLRKNLPSPVAQLKELEVSTASAAQRNEMTTRVSPGIDVEGITQRIVALPVPVGNYYGVVAGKAGNLFLIAGPQVEDPDSNPATTVYKFDLKGAKTDEILRDVSPLRPSSPVLDRTTSFRVSFDGETMLYAKGSRWFMTPVESENGGLVQSQTEHALALDNIQIYVEPRIEWRHIFEQVWRDQRIFFYDPGLHGIDLDALKQTYAPYLENLASRDDLDYLLNEMLGNLSVGHMWALGPATFEHKRPKTGLLGADYSIENGRYRFARIFSGDSWNPDLRAPLAQWGADVHIGEYLLALNGLEVRPPSDIYSFFADTAGKEVVLTVGSKPDGSDSRKLTVVPLDDETALRNYAWLEGNQRTVDVLTGGRVAYVYVPDTGAAGYQNFNRYYFAQVGKEAAIIDERYNHGGQSPDYIIDYLRRSVLNYWFNGEGIDTTTPLEGIFGPKVMIINEMAGSGGDELPWEFRKTQLGPLVGKRTWGGLACDCNNPEDLLDGGYVSAIDCTFYNPNGTWDVENHGVEPDIEVEDSPQAERSGHDPQLEAAVAVALDLLKENPAPLPQHPPFPRYQHARSQ